MCFVLTKFQYGQGQTQQGIENISYYIVLFLEMSSKINVNQKKQQQWFLFNPFLILITPFYT